MAATAQGIARPASEPRAAGWRQLLGLLPYLRLYQGRIAWGFILLVVGNLIGVLLPLAIGTIVDSLSNQRALLERFTGLPDFLHNVLLNFYRPLSRETVLFYVAALLGIVALKGFFSFWTRWILIGVSRDVEYDMRRDVLDRLLVMEPEFYVRNRTGELMSRATNDLSSVRMVLGPGIMYSANTIVVMLAAPALMLTLSPMLTLLVAIPVPLVALAVRYFGQVIHARYEQIQALLASLSARVQENLSGVRVVRAYVQEQPETHAFAEINRDYVARNLQLVRTWALFFPALETIIGATFLIVLWQGGRLVLEGRISLGALMAFHAYMGLLIWPMIALGWVTNIFQRGAASMGRLNHILEAKPAIASAAATDGSIHEEVRGEIEFRNLTFAYNANGGPVEVLRNINLRIPAGSTVAIVGPTGSGKSTLAGLVPRLYDAPADTVLIDGRPIGDWPLDALRRSIGYVPQDTFLFSETIRENIAFGVEEVSEGTVENAAQIGGIAADVYDFPKGYDTVVGERGITLSGGQKQRTALARALIRDPRILVLDDAFSSVDTETEEKILRSLGDVMRRRTTILISHRCSTVRDADLIVVLRDGRIVERGTHAELVGLGGYYAELYQKQLLEDELERT